MNDTTRSRRASAALLATALLASVLILAVGAPARAVILDSQNKIGDIVLSDGTPVVLYGEAVGGGAGGRTNKYYYLPTNLRVSMRPDGTPEFLFLKFTTEAKEEQGGISGALMHFLIEWGLTAQQTEELRGVLKKRGAELGGAVEMMPVGAEGGGGFRIVSGVLEDKGMAKSVVTSGKAPLVPGGKAAVAARLDKYGAQLLAATFEKNRSISDVSIALDFTYQARFPAASGSIIIDWSKMAEQGSKIVADYRQWQSGTKESSTCVLIFCASDSEPTYSRSYTQMQSEWDFLTQNKYVTIDFKENLDSEKTAKVREAFFQVFTNAVASLNEPTQQDQPQPAASEDKKKDEMPDIKQGNSYHYDVQKIKKQMQRGRQVININYDTTLRYDHQLVGNLASWYDHVRNNPKCVSSVNLNDPFFQHRDVLFILDLDAKEMFDQAVNYVTVNVRKQRDQGFPFEDHITIDKKYLETNGIRAGVTYSRGEDSNPDVYEYQTQWSIKGGNIWPPNPPWTKGNWEGVTLAPPVVPRTIELEADLAAMQASDITRITAQVRYYQFGEEKEENIQISAGKGTAVTSATIFNDRDAKGYAYRLVINHKKEGKLALPWTAQVGDNYIYAQIPDDLLVQPAALEAAKTAGAAAGAATANVLARFNNLVGGK
jgi:hypothetical protein